MHAWTLVIHNVVILYHTNFNESYQQYTYSTDITPMSEITPTLAESIC